MSPSHKHSKKEAGEPIIQDLENVYFSNDGTQSVPNSGGSEFNLLSKLCDHRILSRTEERLYLERYHDSNNPKEVRDEAFQVLVSCNFKLIMRLAKYYSYKWKIPIEDLAQEGVVGLIHGIQGFDLSKDFKLSTYATNWIRQSISRKSPTLARNIRLPSHVIHTLNKIGKVRGELEMKNGRPPNSDEIANALGMQKGKLQEILFIERDTLSLNEKAGLQKTSELGDWIPEALDPHDPNNSRIVADAINHLSPKHREIILQKYEEQLSVPEIANSRGMSIGVARKLLQTAEQRLKELLMPHAESLLRD